MAQTIIPLQRFRSLFFNVSKTEDLEPFYIAPRERSSTVILAQCTNTTYEWRTVTLAVSSAQGNEMYYLVKDFEIPPKDSRTLLTGRLILQGIDGDQILAPESLFFKEESALDSSDSVVISGFNNFIEIIRDINNVPATSPSGTTNSTRLSAANLIRLFKPQLQLEAVKFARQNFAGIIDDDSLSAKCFRDSGYIIDSLAADIANAANHRSIETGLFYFSGYIQQGIYDPSPVPTLPENQINATVFTISAIGSYINGENIPSIPADRFTSVGVLSSSVFNSLRSVVSNLVGNMVYPFINAGATQAYNPAGSPSSKDIEVGRRLLDNRLSIQKKLSAYVEEKTFINRFLPDFEELRDKCTRDVGFMVDAVANDLITGVNSKSIQYGLSYWDGSTSRLPEEDLPEQVKNTISTVEFLKTYALKVANNFEGVTLSLGVLETKY
jgi:hypothetical protein